MRRFRLSACLALAVSALAFSGAQALPLSCAVGTSVHSGAKILLKGKILTTCAGGAYGCKCVSCYDLSGAPYSACYPLVVAMPK